MATALGSPLDAFTGKTREMGAQTAVPVTFSGLTKQGPLLKGLSDTEQATGSMEKRWRQIWTQLWQAEWPAWWGSSGRWALLGMSALRLSNAGDGWATAMSLNSFWEARSSTDIL